SEDPPVAAAPVEESVQKTGRVPATLSAAKAAIYTLLVERHADEIDITDRAGVRARITSLADEHMKATGLVVNRLDYGHLVDALLRDRSRVNVVLPPLALDGPCMTIRKFSREKLRPQDLLAMGAATADMLQYLRAAVRSRLSILVSGGTSSGKTTLLNILSG